MPVSGDPLDEEVVSFACEIAKRSHARLYSIHVIEVKRTLPLDVDLPAEVERGESILRRAEDVARRYRQELEVEVLQARDAGTAIIEEIDRRAIDLVIMAMRYRKQYDQFVVGSTVQHVLKAAPCRVCLCRAPMP